jgi:hypothetical protein
MLLHFPVKLQMRKLSLCQRETQNEKREKLRNSAFRARTKSFNIKDIAFALQKLLFAFCMPFA